MSLSQLFQLQCKPMVHSLAYLQCTTAPLVACLHIAKFHAFPPSLAVHLKKLIQQHTRSRYTLDDAAHFCTSQNTRNNLITANDSLSPPFHFPFFLPHFRTLFCPSVIDPLSSLILFSSFSAFCPSLLPSHPMDESQNSHDLQASRKRHRPDDASAASFRMPLSMPTDTAKLAHHRSVGNHSQQDNDPMASASADVPNPVLEPLHPPIPNFSAISQGAPRPNSTSHPNGDPPGGIIYNIALPLPNPGRAHRFCQACDHVSKLSNPFIFPSTPYFFSSSFLFLSFRLF